jgi:hypothetical protein
MDAISSLVTGARNAQATFDAAAQQIAVADLPTGKNPDPTNPFAPAPSANNPAANNPAANNPAANNNVDVAGQLTTMMVAADMHHITTAALRAAFSTYRESISLL